MLKNRISVDAVVYYSLVNRTSISVDELLRKIHEFLKENIDKYDIWMPIDRKDLMEFAENHPLRVKMVHTNEGWIIERIHSYRIPFGEFFFNVNDIDRIYGEPWFEDKQLLENFKQQFM